MTKIKKGHTKKKCVQCGGVKILAKHRITCSSTCASKYRNSSKRIRRYSKK